MAVATQFALTDIEYEYIIGIRPDYGIKYIGSDNSSDGTRVLRAEQNGTDSYKIRLGNISMNYQWTYSAAFGIVNEDKFTKRITHMKVFSSTSTYLKIWLHGDRDANAESNLTDPSTVYMWNNNTLVNDSNTTAWVLAAGNDDPSDMCYNVSDRASFSVNTTWDKHVQAQVRYSLNNSNASSGVADFVWVQIAIDIPDTVDSLGVHSGMIWIHIESEN